MHCSKTGRYSTISSSVTSNIGGIVIPTAAFRLGILESRPCSSITRRSLLLLMSARECASSRLVSATTAFRRSISRRVSEMSADAEFDFKGFRSIAPQDDVCTRGAPTQRGLIQENTHNGTLDRSWCSTTQAIPESNSQRLWRGCASQCAGSGDFGIGSDASHTNHPPEAAVQTVKSIPCTLPNAC